MWFDELLQLTSEKGSGMKVIESGLALTLVGALSGAPAAMAAVPAVAQPSAPAISVRSEVSAPSLPRCLDLETNSALGLAGAEGVSKLSAKVVEVGAGAKTGFGPERGVTRAYCQVELTYNSGKSGPKDGYDDGQQQAIGIRVGLPLRPDDGGQPDAWNGKIHNVGSGGCMGVMPSVTTATNAGYASAASDGGHGAPYMGFNCQFGVIQAKHRLNAGRLRDFTQDHVLWQTRWSKKLVRLYYGREPERTYWSGCSQGGREAHIILQTIPEEYDGVLGGGSALYWERFQMAQAWSGLVIKDMLRSKGKTLTSEQIASTVNAEIAGCDAADGVLDGVIGDPRTCRWSAKAATCGVKGAPAGTCLDADQAAAFDTIRRGPTNSRGELIWNPWEPGTVFSANTNYLLSDSVMQWALRDNTFHSDAHLYLDKAHLLAANDPRGVTYEDMATLASKTVSDLVDADAMPASTLDRKKLKFISWTGTADRNIMSRDSIKYLRDMAHHYGSSLKSPNIQSWYRLFLYPGVDHCVGGDGPQPGDVNSGPLFSALVDWVENGRAPDRLTATKYEGQSRPPVPSAVFSPPPVPQSELVVATRPVCPYPKAAVYKGSGGMNDAANFICSGDLETPVIIEQGRLAPHKLENGSGVVPPPYGN